MSRNPTKPQLARDRLNRRLLLYMNPGASAVGLPLPTGSFWIGVIAMHEDSQPPRVTHCIAEERPPECRPHLLAC
jgi:hypothetical protein